MMNKLGYKMNHYGHELSDVPCEHISVIGNSVTDVVYKDHDWSKVGIPNYKTDDNVFKEFNLNAEKELRARVKEGDIILSFAGWMNKELCDKRIRFRRTYS